MQRNSDEGRGEVAQAFTLWLTRMRMELHLQQLPSYGSAAAASALGWVTHSQKLHLQLEHKFCRNSFYQSFSLAKSLDSCVVSSCLGFNRHLESNIKVNNPSHCSWFRIDNKQTTTKQQQKNSLERNIITEWKALNSFQICGGSNRKKERSFRAPLTTIMTMLQE